MEDKIKQLKQKLENISKELDDLTYANDNKNEKMDFSKWIGRNEEDLCIFGKKMIQSIILTNDKSIIMYDNLCRGVYNQPVNYEVIEQKYLKYGDIYIDDIIEKPRLDYFEIYMEKSQNYIYVQFLNEENDVEFIDYYSFNIQPHKKVKRFLRE